MRTGITRGNRNRGALRFILAALLVLVALPAFPPTRAFAADPPARISGIFHLTRVERDAATHISMHYGWAELDPGYPTGRFDVTVACTSGSAYNTWNGRYSYNPGQTTDWGTFTATLYRNDKDARLAYYYIDDEMVLPCGVSHWGYIQNLGRGSVVIPWDPIEGHVSLAKTSAQPEVTDGNPCYSLAGAEYGVYAANGSHMGTIVTDDTGRGSLDRYLELGRYFLKELKAPPGYQLDEKLHWVELTEDSPDATVTVADAPGGDPQHIRLQKIDAETGGLLGAGELSQGSASLAGAEYTVTYYQGIYDTLAEAQKATPARVWIIRTGSSGYSALNDDYLIDGDSLYYGYQGLPMIPFGTVTIVETKAPEGYILPKPGDSNYKVYLTRFVSDSSAPGGVRREGDVGGAEQGNELIQREQVMRGDLELTKYMNIHEPDSIVETGALEPEPQVIFDFYASRDFTATTPKDGATPAFSLTTDADGRASTVVAGIYLIQNPDGTYTQAPRPAGAAGGLPYDSYLCVQRTTDPAYEKCAPLVFTINQDGQVAYAELHDSVVPSAIEVVKVDAETGEVIPYPATWQIYSHQTDRYVKMDDGEGLTDTFTSDADGHLVLSEQLPYGSYLLHELEAPNDGKIGYVLNETDIPFFVTERHDFDAPLVVTAADTPAKGTIRIVKTGVRGKDFVAGATYAVVAKGDVYTLDGTLRAGDGETVATLVTDARGNAISDPLYLGSYTVREVESPDGYLLDPATYEVELAYAGQTTALVEQRLDLKDDEVTIEGEKRDKSSNTPVPDTEFTLYRERETGSGIWETVAVLVTDEAGKFAFFPAPKGSYRLVETRPNPDYASAEESGDYGTRYFTIDENSTSEVQVFYDEKIQLSCEIYEDTINVTSAAFRTDDEDYLRVENVGVERYHYTLDFRSTSNVRADEFTVVDALESVVTGNVRLDELFTPVARGDSDGLFNLWYRTNLTDVSKVYSSANAMDSNPFNPNNPGRTQNWSSVGWKLWQAAIPTTATTHLVVKDLGLAPDEYVTALRFEYGSVEVGFTTRDTVKQALQESKEFKPIVSDWSTNQPNADQEGASEDGAGRGDTDRDDVGQNDTVRDDAALTGTAPRVNGGAWLPQTVASLKPVTYLVTCSTALLPPMTIRDRAIVNIARNVVLSDSDIDAVQTTVIEPFMTSTVPTFPTDITTLVDYSRPLAGELPATGDQARVVERFFVLLLLAFAGVLLCGETFRSYRSRRQE